jgi:hypothetical protein
MSWPGECDLVGAAPSKQCACETIRAAVALLTGGLAMNPTDLSFLPFLKSRSATRQAGDAAMAYLQVRYPSEAEIEAHAQDADAYDAAVSEGWLVQQARHCPTREA